jgi:hypothetical protein
LKVQVTVSDEMVTKIDAYAKEMGISRSALCSVFIGQGVLGFDKAYKLVNDAIDTVTSDLIEKMENDPKVKEEVFKYYDEIK